jgi:acetyl esterase/lipase
MKNTPLIILCAGLLLIVGCAAPASSPTPMSATTSSIPAATNTPDLEVFSVPGPTPQWSNVPYVPEGSSLQRLDVYLPVSGDGPFPTILAIHGGGFRARSKNLYTQMAGPLTELGYAVVSIDYRLAPEDSYPAQVEDVFCARAWIHENHATYGLDDEHVIVMGDSAGGYLAAMLGTIETPSAYLENCPHTLPASDWIQAAVVFYGFYDFTSVDGYPHADIKSGLEPYWGAEFSEIPPETLAEMSPMSWVDGSEPPFLLIHGVSDTAIPSWMSEDFATALEESGVEAELLLIEASHAFIIQPLSSPANRQSLEAIEAFLAALSDR